MTMFQTTCWTSTSFRQLISIRVNSSHMITWPYNNLNYNSFQFPGKISITLKPSYLTSFQQLPKLNLGQAIPPFMVPAEGSLSKYVRVYTACFGCGGSSVKMLIMHARCAQWVHQNARDKNLCICVCAHIHVYQIHPTTIIANCLKGVNVFLLVDVEWGTVGGIFACTN